MRRIAGTPATVPGLAAIVPPHVFSHMANLSDASWPGLATRARESLAFGDEVRTERCAVNGVTPLRAGGCGAPQRTIYDADHGFGLPGRAVRGEGDDASGDVSVDEAYDALGATYQYFLSVHGRDSIDGRGLPLEATVHYRRAFNNAFWNGRQMVFGDGDGEIFDRFTSSLDIIGHELTHGVTQHEAGLLYLGQSGALNEHMSDVFGSLVKQFSLNQTAKKADWLIGSGLWAQGVKGVALRSMKAPGTAYDDPRIGKDPQPAHMRDYVTTLEDNGGVHINSGIPNHAFYLASIAFGGKAWVKAGKVWYHALTEVLGRFANFKAAAQATTDAAGRMLGTSGARIVSDAWKQVGVEVKTISGRVTGTRKKRKGPGARSGRARTLADPRGAERRDRRAS